MIRVSDTKRGAERLEGFRSFTGRKISERAMYPWPGGEFDNVMDDALNIALQYLDHTGQIVRFKEAQFTAAMAIATAWKRGERRRIKLADLAIVAVEHGRPIEGPKFAWEPKL